MPLDLQSLINRVAHVSVPIGAESIEVDYRPDLVTGETQRIIAASGGNPNPDPLFLELARVVVGWDLTNGGQPVPVTIAAIAGLGLQISLQTLLAIVRDAGNPKAVTTRAPMTTLLSSNGSSTMVGSATVPITTTSSPLPNGHTSPPGILPDSPTPASVFAGATGSPT